MTLTINSVNKDIQGLRLSKINEMRKIYIVLAVFHRVFQFKNMARKQRARLGFKKHKKALRVFHGQNLCLAKAMTKRFLCL